MKTYSMSEQRPRGFHQSTYREMSSLFHHIYRIHRCHQFLRHQWLGINGCAHCTGTAICRRHAVCTTAVLLLFPRRASSRGRGFWGSGHWVWANKSVASTYCLLLSYQSLLRGSWSEAQSFLSGQKRRVPCSIFEYWLARVPCQISHNFLV